MSGEATRERAAQALDASPRAADTEGEAAEVLIGPPAAPPEGIASAVRSPPSAGALGEPTISPLDMDTERFALPTFDPVHARADEVDENPHDSASSVSARHTVDGVDLDTDVHLVPGFGAGVADASLDSSAADAVLQAPARFEAGGVAGAPPDELRSPHRPGWVAPLAAADVATASYALPSSAGPLIEVVEPDPEGQRGSGPDAAESVDWYVPSGEMRAAPPDVAPAELTPAADASAPSAQSSDVASEGEPQLGRAHLEAAASRALMEVEQAAARRPQRSPPALRRKRAPKERMPARATATPADSRLRTATRLALPILVCAAVLAVVRWPRTRSGDPCGPASAALVRARLTAKLNLPLQISRTMPSANDADSSTSARQARLFAAGTAATDPVLALQAWSASIELDPSSEVAARARVARGWLLLALGRGSDAKADLLKAKEQPAKRAGHAACVARLLERIAGGTASGALTLVEPACGAPPASLANAAAAVALGDVQGERSSDSSSRAEAAGQQAQTVALAQTATDPLIALRLWTRAIETAPDAARGTTAQVERARLLVALGRFDEAERDTSQAKDHNPAVGSCVNRLAAEIADGRKRVH